MATAFQPGERYTFGNSKLEWVVDAANAHVVHLNRQHMRPGARHHLSFKKVWAKDFDKLHKVEVPEVMTNEQDAQWRKDQGYAPVSYS
jgi:hypothetical protein